MRFTKEIRPLLIGLPVLVAQAIVPAAPIAAWEWGGWLGKETTAAPSQKPPVAGTQGIAPTTPRWTDGQSVQQAYAPGVARAGSVQQTAHNGPSRNGTLFGGPNTAGQPAGKKAPTWHGQSVRMPTTMFNRAGANGQPATGPHPSAGQQRPAGLAPAQPGPSSHASASRPTGGPNSRTAAATPPAKSERIARNLPDSKESQPAAQSRQSSTDKPSVTASAPTSTSAPQSALIATAEPVLTRPTAPEAAPAAIEPKSPGDKLILQAHEFSTRATTEDDYSRIIETCRRARASQLSPSLDQFASQLTAWSLNRRGQLKAEGGHAQEALLDFDDAIRANPELWRALHNRGVLRAQTAQYEQAFDDFNLTIHYNPQFAKAYTNRAALFIVAGDQSSALEDYNRAIELDPNLAIAHRGCARIYHQQGRLEDALNHFDAAVQLTPNDAYALSSRADLLTDLGRYSDAAKQYNRAIQLDPQSVGALRGSAWLLATCPDSSVRNAKLAVQRAEQAARLEGKNDSINLDTLAAAQASAGDFSGAMQTMRQAIQIAPDEEREVYEDRLKLYERAKPYRIAPVRGVAQVSYESE